MNQRTRQTLISYALVPMISGVVGGAVAELLTGELLTVASVLVATFFAVAFILAYDAIARRMRGGQESHT